MSVVDAWWMEHKRAMAAGIASKVSIPYTYFPVLHGKSCGLACDEVWNLDGVRRTMSSPVTWHQKADPIFKASKTKKLQIGFKKIPIATR